VISGDHQQRVVVTGCAGFLGSHLSERLIDLGYDVVGIDAFTDYYPRLFKESNLARLRDEPGFTLAELDLSSNPLDMALEGAAAVFHLAAQPGVRGSFGDTFATYVRNNVLATQRLLEAAVRHTPARFVYASSSSVYGDTVRYPTPETAECRPVSPYGMTKVTTEGLADIYHRTCGVPVVGLRFFTAYGPRQRPDMAFSRFIRSAITGRPLRVLGDGHQIRDFTYVDDVIAGTLGAAERGRAGAVYNIGGGTPVELLGVVASLERMLERRIEVQRLPAPLGEARVTAADTSLAARELRFTPKTLLHQGLAAQIEWVLATEHRAVVEAAGDPVASGRVVDRRTGRRRLRRVGRLSAAEAESPAATAALAAASESRERQHETA
jgi:nucleoside-diphosphate-sugar epimerase